MGQEQKKASERTLISYLNFSLLQFSCIDYFCVSNNIFDLLTKHSVRNDSLNPSNHALISIEMPSFVNINNSSYLSDNKCFPSTKPLWHISKYENKLNCI